LWGHIILKHDFIRLRKLAVRYKWLMPVVLGTWEAEIWRIMVCGQPRRIVLKSPSPK
jgi:hypothetical protein